MRSGVSLLLASALVACGAQYSEQWDPRVEAAVMLVAPPYYRAGCSAVATGPREITTAKHCALPAWEYLTHEDWKAGGPPGRATLDECRAVVPLYGHDDGFCWYVTDRQLTHWSPRVSRPCEHERVSTVHHATGSAWALALGYSYEAPAPGWLRVSLSPGPGASGAPVWCGEDLIGVYVLTRHVVTW